MRNNKEIGVILNAKSAALLHIGLLRVSHLKIAQRWCIVFGEPQ